MIAVAGMDGKSQKSLITDNIHWPNGLALDWQNNRLYWVDAKVKLIESCKLDGSGRRAVIQSVSKHPYGIAIFMDKLYWSDWDSKSIQSCDKFTGKNREIIVRDNVIYDLHIYHPSMQQFTQNVCNDNACSHLCLLNMNMSYTCACPKYMELKSDKHTCTSTGKQKAVLLGIGNRFVIFEHQSFGRHDAADGQTMKFYIDKMAYNSITGDVLVADNREKVIYQVNLHRYTTKKIITKNIGNVTAMAYGKLSLTIKICISFVIVNVLIVQISFYTDNLANNLYWSDAERSTIEVYSFNTQHRAIVQHFMGTETPIGLATVPAIGSVLKCRYSCTVN